MTLSPPSLLARLRIPFVVTAFAAAVSAVPALSTTVTPLPPGRSPISGIQDDGVLETDPAPRIRTMAEAGASIIRVELRWWDVAPTRPANAADPNDPAYQWARYDAIVQAAQANGVEVLFTVWGTPLWAIAPDEIYTGDPRYGSHSHAPQDPADFGAFAQAAAARYAPQGVKKWEGWNEPNVPLFLQPQYRRVNGRWVAASPGIYAGLQKAFYAGIKSVDRTAVVAGAVTAPAGERCSSCPVNAPPLRVVPMDFLVALNSPALRPPMDVVSHHPYPLRKPGPTPPNRSYSDLYNLSDMTKAIDKTYLRKKPLWLTEYGFATAPVKEYTLFFSLARQATYISDAYARLRMNPRVKLAIYYNFRDHARWRSGLLTIGGAKKPGFAAYALPLTAVPTGRTFTLYGQVRSATGRTPVRIQRFSRGRWITMRVVRTAPDGGFILRVRPTGATRLRAWWSGTTRAGTRAVRVSGPVSLPAG